MDRTTIEKEVHAIIVEQLEVDDDQVTETASFENDLGADSLDCVELCMAFEEEFEIEITEEEQEKLVIVLDVVNLIEKKLAEPTK